MAEMRFATLNALSQPTQLLFDPLGEKIVMGKYRALHRSMPLQEMAVGLAAG